MILEEDILKQEPVFYQVSYKELFPKPCVPLPQAWTSHASLSEPRETRLGDT